MGFFKNRENAYDSAQMFATLEETKTRCMSFIEKLENRMEELCVTAIPELKQAYKDDDDPYHRSHGRMVSAILGQLSHMNEKLRDTLEEKVEGVFQEYIEYTQAGSSEWKALYALRHECAERKMAFEATYHNWRKEVENSAEADLEEEYRLILQEYESIRHSFLCQQCGAPILVDRIYFIPVYLTCTHCNTQNTFEPSSKARSLEHLARSLAEQRSAHILEAYNESHRQGDKDAPLLYERYLEAMFKEWNSIVPDLTEQNNKFHQRLLNDFRRQYTE